MTTHKSTLYIISLILFVLLVSLIYLPTTQASTLSGDWENDLYFAPQASDLLDLFRSTLSVSYSSGGVSYSSESIFYKDEFYSQTLGAGLRLGIVDIDSTAYFDPTKKRLGYWLNEAGFTLAGARIDTTFLLEHTDNLDSYGAGLELGVSGNLSKGLSADFTSRFGMEESEAEQLGVVIGSGYTIVTSDGEYGPSQLQYVDSELQLTGMVFDCCSYDVTTKFSEEKGFEETEFEFNIGGENNPISFEVDLTFTTQTKSIELDPSIDTTWGCFDVYADLTTSNVDDLLGNNSVTVSSLGGLQIEGFGISNVSLGHVTFSSLTALDGNLYRPIRTYDMDLRAGDYVIDPALLYRRLYKETDYDEIFSLEKKRDEFPLTLGVDFYFDMSGDQVTEDSIFDLALITGNGRYQLSDQFSLGAGVAVEPGALKRFRLSFGYSF